MQLYAISTNYKPLEIQSNDSISQERKEIYKETLQNNLKESGGISAELYLPPESFLNALDYLGGGNFISKAHSAKDNPLSFQNTQEQSLASQANYQMQNFLNLPNPAKDSISQKVANFKNTSNNTFGGYSTDEKGFMGEDFNQAANLPSDYQIHKNALQALKDFYTLSLFSEFESIDLIAGISAANKELNALFTDDKRSYTKEEIMQATKGSKGEFFEFDFEALLMQDYKNEDGTFQREGILLMYAVKSGILENTESPYTMRRENKESPSDEQLYNAKEKTPQEKAKELKDALDEYYLKALTASKSGNTHNQEDSISSGIAKELHKDRIGLELESATEKPKDHSVGGEWIKVQRG